MKNSFKKILLTGIAITAVSTPFIAKNLLDAKKYASIESKLTNLYNSIDVAKVSDKEKKWLEEISQDSQKILNADIKQEANKKQYKILDKICGLEHISEKDKLLLYRIFNDKDYCSEFFDL